MFLHLGGDIIVPKNEVIAIIDLNSSTKSETTREFIQVSEEEGFISEISDKSRAKSLVITSKVIYYSPISSTTLKKRSDYFRDMIEGWEKNL